MDHLAKSLHEKALRCVGELRRSETALIAILQEIELHKVFLQLGYGSLYTYAVEELKLTEASAMNFINVARKAREIPEITAALAKGELSVSKVRKLTPVLTPENAEKWLEKAKTLPKWELEREVAKVVPKSEPLTLKTRVSFDRMALQLGISEALMQDLLRIQDLLSQKRRAPVNLEAALTAMAKEFLQRHDPIQKAERAQEREEKREKIIQPPANLPVPGQPTSETNGNRRPLSSLLDETHVEGETLYAFMERNYGRETVLSRIRHEITGRDKSQCTYIHPNGKRCKQRRWLEMHHILPVSHGGKNEPENLRLLCAAHHRLTHEDLYSGRKREGSVGQMDMNL